MNSNYQYFNTPLQFYLFIISQILKALKYLKLFASHSIYSSKKTCIIFNVQSLKKLFVKNL